MTVKDIERIGSPAISRADARRAFLEYRRAVTLEADTERRQEYDGLMRGYRAIAKGAQVIDLHQTMHVAGLQPETGYPCLAIARADAKYCLVNLGGAGTATFFSLPSNDRWQRMPRAHGRRTVLPEETLPRWSWEAGGGLRRRLPDGRVVPWSNDALAVVPIIPPQFHPRAALSNYHILWDAVWVKAPPKDPLLLRRLSGALYAIVAHWDLSPLEQAVLRGRL